MKYLDKYIAYNFLMKFILIMIGLLIIIILIDIIDHLGKFIDTDISKLEIINYYLYSIPWFISIGIPISCLIATNFCLGFLNKNNEITALKASGISIYRFTRSLLIIGLLISIFSFYFDNFFVTSTLNQRSEIEIKYFLKNKSKSIKSKKNIYRQISRNQFLSIHRFYSKKNEASNISIQNINDNNLIYRIDAPLMKWNESTKSWDIPNYTLRSWDNDVENIIISKDTSLNLNFDPIDLARELLKPEEMNYSELYKFVKKLKENGIHEPRWEVNLHFKTAFAATSTLMILLGIPIAIRQKKSNFAMTIGISILFIFLYYASLKFGQSMGVSGQLDPFISVWSVNLLYFCLGLIMLFKAKT